MLGLCRHAEWELLWVPGKPQVVPHPLCFLSYVLWVSAVQFIIAKRVVILFM